MNKYFKLLIHEPKKNAVLKQLREQLLKRMLIVSFAVGTVLYGFALIPAISKGLYSTILVYTVSLVWIILITFLPRLPYRLRAICWIGNAYILGCLNLVESGFNVDVGLFFIAFIAMAILLLDLQGGLAAIVLASVTVSVSGYINVSKHINLPMGLPQSDPLLWIIGGIIFLFIGILLIYSQAIVLHGLEENLAKATLLANELEQTNKSLRMTEARHRTLVETSPGLVAQLDLNGNILMVNQIGLVLFGYKNLKELAGKNMLVLFARDDQPRVLDAIQRALETGRSKELECSAIRKDSVAFTAEFSAALFEDEAGNPSGMWAIVRDISERKLIEENWHESERRYWSLLDNSLQGVIVIQDMRIVFANQAFMESIGYDRSEVKTFTPAEILQSLHPEDRRMFQEKLQRDLDRGSKPERYSLRVIRKNGEIGWFETLNVPIRLEGKPALIITGVDVSKIRQAEAGLRESLNAQQAILNSIDAIVFLADTNSVIISANDKLAKRVGMSPESLIGISLLTLVPDNVARGRLEHFDEAISSGKTITFMDSREGKWFENSFYPIQDASGKVVKVVVFSSDITEQRRITEALRESEQRYRELLDSSMQGVVVFQDMRIVYVNQTLLEVFGYTDSEFKALRWAEIVMRVHPDDRRMFFERLHKSLGGDPTPEQYTLRVIRKNGEMRWAEVKTSPIILQGKPATLTTGIDVSEIRQAQAELQESERILQTILNAFDALVFLVDANGFLIASNDKFANRMGLKADSIAGTSMYDLLPEEVLRARKVPFDQVISSGRPITFVDARGDTWFENSMYPIQDVSGKVVSVAVYARDITEQRRVTEALRTSEEKYRNLAEAAHDMIFIINRDDRIEYVNSFGANFLGQEPQKLVGQPRALFFPPETSQHQEDHILQVFRTGEAISSESANDFPTSTVWLHTWLVPLKDSSGEVTSVLGVSRDITERKRSEEALRQARDRLEERVEERTKELLTSQEKLQFLTAQTIAAQEEERRSISRELHDEAGQALITLKYGLAAIQNELPGRESLARKRLSESMKIIDQAMLHIRALAQSLRPPVLEVGGIHLSLQDYCLELAGRTQIPISYQGRDIPELPDEIGISLFRFVQEALTNIMKHAQATKVKVRLQYVKGEINLSVSDNGRGIADTSQTEGLGLLGIKERLILMGGKLDILSQKGRGTKLVASVPWMPSKIK